MKGTSTERGAFRFFRQRQEDEEPPARKYLQKEQTGAILCFFVTGGGRRSKKVQLSCLVFAQREGEETRRRLLLQSVTRDAVNVRSGEALTRATHEDRRPAAAARER